MSRKTHAFAWAAIGSLAALYPMKANAVPCRRVAVASASVSATSVASIAPGFVAVPFAVPVAMPSYVQYQSPVATYSTAPTTPCHVPTQGATPAPAPAASATAAAPLPSLVAQHCSRCHGGAKPKAGLDLTQSLDDATRLKAIARILSDDPQNRMPQGKELSPAALGELIQELATSAVSPTLDDPTPSSSASRDTAK